MHTQGVTPRNPGKGNSSWEAEELSRDFTCCQVLGRHGLVFKSQQIRDLINVSGLPLKPQKSPEHRSSQSRALPQDEGESEVGPP